MGNALDAMTGLSLGEYIKHPGMRKIGIQILKEALRIVEKGEIQLESLPGIPVSGFKLIIKAPVPIAAFILKYIISSKDDANIETSTLQSLRKGKKTEIDYLNGEFVGLAKHLEMPALYNSKVVELIHNIENTHSFYSPEELVSIFSAL